MVASSLCIGRTGPTESASSLSVGQGHTRKWQLWPVSTAAFNKTRGLRIGVSGGLLWQLDTPRAIKARHHRRRHHRFCYRGVRLRAAWIAGTNDSAIVHTSEHREERIRITLNCSGSLEERWLKISRSFSTWSEECGCTRSNPKLSPIALLLYAFRLPPSAFRIQSCTLASGAELLT